MARKNNSYSRPPPLPAWDVKITGAIGPEPVVYRVHAAGEVAAMNLALERAHNDPARIYHVLHTERPVRVETNEEGDPEQPLWN